MKTKFYHFNQNNSGGSFIGVKDIIIEALDAKHANCRAEDFGIYFNGCETGEDCPCCGDRWTSVSESDGSDQPSIYGKPVENVSKSYFMDVVEIKYIDGTSKVVELKEC